MADYIAVAKRTPKTVAVHAYVNQRLREIAEGSRAPYEICYFKSGDRYPRYVTYPRSLSIETVRSAIKKFGIPELRTEPVA